MEYTTRNLTADESARLMRSLHLTLGTVEQAHAALRVIANAGCGIFVATPAAEADA